MIKCQWREQNRLLVNIDGQVYPCCYLVNEDYTRFTRDGVGNVEENLMSEYNEIRDELNIFKTDLDTINNHPWWGKLEKSWDDPEKALHNCRRWCTVKDNIDE